MNWLQRLLKILIGSDVSSSPPPSETVPTVPLPRPSVPPPQTGVRSGSPPVRPPAPKPLDFSAADFLPLTQSELSESDREMRSWSWLSNRWWGRRDLIPPPEDPRTRRIDHGLVTQGLLSPAELAEMHNVGTQMLKHRDRLAEIQHQ